MKPDEVHVRTFRFDAPEAAPPDLSALSDEERARAESMRVPSARRAFLVSRALLRGTLAQYAGAAPESLGIEVLPSGKPRLAAPHDLQFNLAHSPSTWVLAVARGNAVGVDIEDLNRRVDIDAVARRLFAPSEVGILASLSEAARRRAFFRVWAQREAVVKALGRGMLETGRAFEVEADPTRPPSVRGADLALAEWFVGDGSVCIVAREGARRPLVLVEPS